MLMTNTKRKQSTHCTCAALHSFRSCGVTHAMGHVIHVLLSGCYNHVPQTSFNKKPMLSIEIDNVASLQDHMILH